MITSEIVHEIGSQIEPHYSTMTNNQSATFKDTVLGLEQEYTTQLSALCMAYTKARNDHDAAVLLDTIKELTL